MREISRRIALVFSRVCFAILCAWFGFLILTVGVVMTLGLVEVWISLF